MANWSDLRSVKKRDAWLDLKMANWLGWKLVLDLGRMMGLMWVNNSVLRLEMTMATMKGLCLARVLEK